MLEAILWKPEFRWQVVAIEILEPIRFIGLRRNEMKQKASVPAIRQWMHGSSALQPLWADATKDEAGTDMIGRTQRQTMALKEVAYRVHAEVLPWSGQEEERAKYTTQFQRRVARGQCHHQPSLGLREFAAYFGPPTDRTAVNIDIPIGWMVYDVFDLNARASAPTLSLFHAAVRAGRLDVPLWDSDGVVKQG
jgi:CRISPR-associated protein Cas5d